MKLEKSESLQNESAYVQGLEKRISELEANIQTMKTFIDNSEAGMYVSDYNTGEVLFANRKTVTLFDSIVKNADVIFGKTCWELINKHGEGRCSFCPYKELVGSDGQPLDVYTWEYYFSDYGIWMRILSQAIVWTDGRLAQINTFYDITETKRMQEELAAHAREKEYHKMQLTLQNVLDMLPVPVSMTDIETAEFVYANKAFAKMFDYAVPEDMYELKVTDIMPPLQSDGTASREKAEVLLHSNESDPMEIEYLTSKGELVDGLITVCFIEYNGRQTMLAIIANLALEREQRRLLQIAADREREANRHKSSFLSNMSHEVRTPMNAIIGLTEIELRKKHTKAVAEVYKKINISAKSLLQIVNDILDLTKIEEDKLELIPCEFVLEDVLNNALLVVSPRLEGRSVELLLDLSPCLPQQLIGDKTRLWQILKNFLDNAAKFTQVGYILLSVTEDKEKSTPDAVYITFTISDTGIGMDEFQLEKAFLPYEQIESEAQRIYTGTGLGMPLSKRICELMDGVLRVDSELGSGTIASFTVPFKRTLKNKTECTYPSLKGLKVLAVDDSCLSLKIMGSLLKNSSADFIVAVNGKEAVQVVKKCPDFDIILLDFVIEGENALETISMLRKSVSPSTGIIIVTAYGSLVDRDGLEEYGITELIEKPFVPSVFYERILVASGRIEAEQDSEPDGYTKFRDVRILVCEDNDLNRMVAGGMLEQFGITVVFAENGERGLEMMDKNGPFDLVLMDLHMPVMDGYKAARAIRTDSRYNDIPIISLTADAMSEVIDKCLSCGMNGYLAKPFVTEDFHSLLLKWLPENKRET